MTENVKIWLEIQTTLMKAGFFSRDVDGGKIEIENGCGGGCRWYTAEEVADLLTALWHRAEKAGVKKLAQVGHENCPGCVNCGRGHSNR